MSRCSPRNASLLTTTRSRRTPVRMMDMRCTTMRRGKLCFPIGSRGRETFCCRFLPVRCILSAKASSESSCRTSMSSSMMEIGGRRSRMSNALSAKERDLKHAEHKRYYARTAFKYERRRWTVDEDKLVLIHRIPDSELSPIIKRSMKSISNRRWRLRKAASENKETGDAGE